MESETTTFDIDDAWDSFIAPSQVTDDNYNVLETMITNSVGPTVPLLQSNCPEPSSIRISTKTRIAYIEPSVDIYDLFWKIPIINYSDQIIGVVKKEMKHSSLDKIDFNSMMDRCSKENFIRFHIVKHIDKETGSVRFKDVRKIISGISKHDINHKRCKPKGAFFNCVVANIRIYIQNMFREYHVKIFNSGKIELPGTHEEGVYELVVDYITTMISNTSGIKISISKNNNTALVNSNFSCNYMIDRDKLMEILKHKYNILCSFDPCSYPGIRCTIKLSNLFDNEEINTIGESSRTMTCMIFRTGSVLLVGKCDDYVLNKLYRYIGGILKDEYIDVCTQH